MLLDVFLLNMGDKMNTLSLLGLKQKVDRAIEKAGHYGKDPRDVRVSVHFDTKYGALQSIRDIDIIYDNDINVDGLCIYTVEIGEG